jgi:hypothetical protein
MRRKVHTARRLIPVLAIALAACAKEEMPPGTGPDFEPPSVVEMFPEHGSTVPDLDEDAYVGFDEPLGDPRSVARVVETSPAWSYEINAGRRNVRIRPRDGWRPGIVYTFRIPPGLRDLVRNQTREPIEFLFSTGTEISDTRTTGTVWDRETVVAVRQIAVQVIGGDSVPYAAVTDTGGNFTLPALPVGDYWAFAFRDQNQNRILDRGFEPHDSGRVILSDRTSVARLDLWLTSPDSTPPQLGSAEATDSLHIRLGFDDLLEPDAPLGEASVRVARAATGEEWPVSEFVVGALPVVDSTSSDAADADSIEADADLQADPITPEPTDQGEISPDETVEPGWVAVEKTRPQRFVSVRLGRALSEGTYDVSARGFLNLRLLAGGGDTTIVYEPPDPLPEPEPLDAVGEEEVESAVGEEVGP